MDAEDGHETSVFTEQHGVTTLTTVLIVKVVTSCFVARVAAITCEHSFIPLSKFEVRSAVYW